MLPHGKHTTITRRKIALSISANMVHVLHANSDRIVTARVSERKESNRIRVERKKEKN